MSNYTMGALAYSLGIGMGSTMVAVRKAYAGSYSKLLAMQKVAEASVPTVIVLVGGSPTAGAASSVDCNGGRVDQHVDVGGAVHWRSTALWTRATPGETTPQNHRTRTSLLEKYLKIL